MAEQPHRSALRSLGRPLRALRAGCGPAPGAERTATPPRRARGEPGPAAERSGASAAESGPPLFRAGAAGAATARRATAGAQVSAAPGEAGGVPTGRAALRFRSVPFSSARPGRAEGTRAAPVKLAPAPAEGSRAAGSAAAAAASSSRPLSPRWPRLGVPGRTALPEGDAGGGGGGQAGSWQGRRAGRAEERRTWTGARVYPIRTRCSRGRIGVLIIGWLQLEGTVGPPSPNPAMGCVPPPGRAAQGPIHGLRHLRGWGTSCSGQQCQRLAGL